MPVTQQHVITAVAISLPIQESSFNFSLKEQFNVLWKQTHHTLRTWHVGQTQLYEPVLTNLSYPNFVSSLPADWAACGKFQTAQRSHHVCGMEPHRLKRVCSLRSRRHRQPVGLVSGVKWRGRQGGGGEGPAPSAPLPAPGSVRD